MQQFFDVPFYYISSLDKIFPPRGGITGNFDYGWGNGYAIIRQRSYIYGIKDEELYVDIHGGITFAGSRPENFVEAYPKAHYAIGFDTAHSGDNLKNWSKERVEAEAKELAKQALRLGYPELFKN